MAFMKRRDLTGRQLSTFSEGRLSHQYRKKSAATTEVAVFLSHSHRDADIIEALATFLRNENCDAYVDWKDATMPRVTSAETARRLKAKIRECPKFIVVATRNSLGSKWVPWELGVADSFHTSRNVAILPVVENDGWKGSEYIGMYPRISTSEVGVWSVYPPERTTGGVPLTDWLVR